MRIKRRTIIPAWIPILMCGSIACLQAGGEQEESIQNAAELIEQKETEQAFELLGQALAQDPDNIEEIEAVLALSRNRRRAFVGILEQVVDTLQNDPEDFDRISELVAQLDALDVYPNEELKRIFGDAGRLARQAGDRRIVRESIREIELLLSEARFLEALNVAGASTDNESARGELSGTRL